MTDINRVVQADSDQHSLQRRIQHNVQVHPASTLRFIGAIFFLFALAQFLTLPQYFQTNIPTGWQLIFSLSNCCLAAGIIVEVVCILSSTYACQCGTVSSKPDMSRQFTMMKRNYKWYLLFFAPFFLPIFVALVFHSFAVLHALTQIIGATLFAFSACFMLIGLSNNSARQKVILQVMSPNLLTESQLANYTDEELDALCRASRVFKDYENADAISKVMLDRAERLLPG